MRFNQRQVFGQCAPCNNHLSGNAIRYRQGLVELYGEEYVLQIEADQTPRKFTLDEIHAIKNYYKMLCKRLTEKTDSVY
jgi:hypothetical protein